MILNAICCMAIGLASLGLVSPQDPVPQGPAPVPPVVCGAPAKEFTSNVATSALAQNYHSKARAIQKAKDEILGKLASASGVVCAICDNGIQCTRYATVADAQWSEPDCEQSSSGRWWCAIAHTGKYKAGCKDC